MEKFEKDDIITIKGRYEYVPFLEMSFIERMMFIFFGKKRSRLKQKYVTKIVTHAAAEILSEKIKEMDIKNGRS